MADPVVPPNNLNDTSFAGLLNAPGRGNLSSGLTVTTFLTSLTTAFAIFGLQLLAFLLLKHKLFRI